MHGSRGTAASLPAPCTASDQAHGTAPSSSRLTAPCAARRQRRARRRCGPRMASCRTSCESAVTHTVHQCPHSPRHHASHAAAPEQTPLGVVCNQLALNCDPLLQRRPRRLPRDREDGGAVHPLLCTRRSSHADVQHNKRRYVHTHLDAAREAASGRANPCPGARCRSAGAPTPSTPPAAASASQGASPQCLASPAAP